MVPVIAANGASFNGAFRYYCHDKQGRTTNRVEWTQTLNILTDCAAKAWKVMAYTAMNQDRLKEASGQKPTGAKLKKPVFAFSLSWAPEQRPDKRTMLEAAKRSLEALGLIEHQAIIVAHSDRPHRHVHIVANTVHPLTGLVAQLKHTKRKLSDFALQYEQEGGKIYCSKREENRRTRDQGKSTRYSDPQMQDAWDSTNTGSAFVAALEEKGYRLAQGRKRLVVIDPYGKTHNPARLLKDVKAADILRRLDGIDLSRLPDADEAAAEIARQSKRDEDLTKNENAADEPRPEPTPKAPEPETVPSRPEADPGDHAAPETPRVAEDDQQGGDETSSFERLAATQRTEMRERHDQERARLDEQARARLLATKRRLLKFYDLPDRKGELIALRSRIDGAAWWKRLFGLTKKDEARFGERLSEYRDAVSRYRENVSHAKSQVRDTLAELDRRQLSEQTRFEFNLARSRDSDRAPDEQALYRPRHNRDRPPEKEIEGPGLTL
jgi:Relaxase/Mobilisation nuclease domain